MKLLRRNGQSIGEYAIMLGIVLGAVFSVQGYIRNRISAGIQASASHYLGGATAPTAEFMVESTSSSRSESEAKFSTFTTGKAESGSVGTSKIVNPQDE